MRTVSVCWISDLGAMLTLVRAATEVCREWKQDWKRLRSECEVRKWPLGDVRERESSKWHWRRSVGSKKSVCVCVCFKLGDCRSH